MTFQCCQSYIFILRWLNENHVQPTDKFNFRNQNIKIIITESSQKQASLIHLPSPALWPLYPSPSFQYFKALARMPSQLPSACGGRLLLSLANTPQLKKFHQWVVFSGFKAPLSNHCHNCAWLRNLGKTSSFTGPTSYYLQRLWLQKFSLIRQDGEEGRTAISLASLMINDFKTRQLNSLTTFCLVEGFGGGQLQLT